MKNALLFLILLHAFPLMLSAQEWLPERTTWYYTNSTWGQVVNVNTYQITGEAEILGKRCQVLQRSILTCDLRPDQEYLYQENDSLFYYEPSVNNFQLLYDFSAELHDTIRLPFWPGMGWDSFYIRIDSIATFYLDTLALKEFYVSYGIQDGPDKIIFSPYDFPRKVIIEDIGSTGNFFHWVENGGCDGYHTYGLRCFDQPDYSIAKFTTEACDSVVVGVHNLYDNPTVRIYPNPASTWMRIEVEQDNEHSWILNDIFGRTVMRQQAARAFFKATEIDTSELKNGVYYLQILDERRHLIAVKKFIKL